MSAVVPQTATSVFAAEPDVAADGTADEPAVDTPDVTEPADTGSDETVTDPAGTETVETDGNADDAASGDGVDTPAQSGAEETEQPADAQEQDEDLTPAPTANLMDSQLMEDGDITVNVTKPEGISAITYLLESTDKTNAPEEITGELTEGKTITIPNADKSTNDLYLKITTAEGYKISDVSGVTCENESTHVTPGKAEGNVAVYKIAKEAWSSKTELSVSIKAEKKKYAVKLSNAAVTGATVTVDQDTSSEASHEFTDKATHGEQISFKVALAGEENKITGVTVKVAGSDLPLNSDNFSEFHSEEDNWIGTYTIKGEKVTGDIEITVNTTPYDKHSVTFEVKPADSMIKTSEGLMIKIGETEEDIISAKSKTDILETKDVSFKVAAADKYEITKVTWKGTGEETELTKGTDGYYPLGKLKEDVTVTITAAIDSKQAYSIKATGNKAGAFTMKLYNTSKSEITTADKILTTADGTVVTTENTVYAVFTPVGNYSIPENGISFAKSAPGVTNVEPVTDESNGPSVDYTKAKVYKIEFDAENEVEGKTQTFTVNTEAGAIKSDITVTFKNNSESLTPGEEVTATGTGENLITLEGDKYTVKTGAKTLNFTVTAKEGWTPKLTFQDTDASAAAKPITAEKSENDVYTYSVDLAEFLTESKTDYTITMDAEVAKQTVKVYYATEEVSLAHVTESKGTYDNEQSDETKGHYDTIELNHKEKITFTAKALEHCTIVKVANGTTDITDASKQADGTYQFEVTADGLTTKGAEGTAAPVEIYITSQKDYWVTLTQRSDALKAADGVYTLDAGESYTLKLFEGNDAETAVEMSGVTSSETDEKKFKAALDAGKKSVTLEPLTADQSVTLTLKVTDPKDEEKKKEIEVATVKVLVAKSMASITVVGATKRGNDQVINQTADTVKTYDLKLNPVTANLDKVSVDMKVKNDAGKTATDEKFNVEIVEGQLQVTTPQNVLGEEKTATVVLYAAKDPAETAPKDSTDKNAQTLATLVINAEDQLAGTRPSLKIGASTDTDLRLDLGLPAKVTAPKTSDLYYEIYVEATLPEDADKKKAITECLGNDGKMYFYREVAQTDGKLQTSQTEEILVIKTDPAGKITEGFKNDFQVSVRLVQPKQDSSISTDKGQAKAVADTLLTSVSDTKADKVSSKDLYYEDKLKVKKGTTTVYTGQGSQNGDTGKNGVLIATAQWGKLTSAMELDDAVTATTDIDYSGNEALEVSVKDGDKVYVKTKKDRSSGNCTTALGKHTIQIVAKAENGMTASKTTVAVTVVQGIKELKVTVPAVDLYQKANNKATLKAAVEYNKDAKTKKVTWSVYSLNESDNSGLKDNVVETDGSINDTVAVSTFDAAKAPAGVSVKNGTVTVDKTFQVKKTDSDAYANSFVIVARAADFGTLKAGDDFAANEVIGVSPVITVTNTGADAGEFVLGKLSGSEYILLNDAASYTQKDLAGQQLLVLTSTAKKTTEEGVTKVGKDDVSDPANFTFKSSNKAVTIEGNTITAVTKTAKNVKLQAVFNDGSKRKALEKTVTVGYAAPESALGLQLDAEDADHSSNLQDGTLSTTLNVKGSAGTRIKVTVVDGGDGKWAKVDDMMEYKITAKNAKLQTVGGDTIVVPTKAGAKVTLTAGSGSAKKVTDYTINSTAFADGLKKAPGVKLNGSLSGSSSRTNGKFTGIITPKSDKKNPLDLSADTYYVRIEADLSAANAKNIEDYNKLFSEAVMVPVDRNGSFEFSIASDAALGTYKLKCTVGTKGEAGIYDKTFVPVCQAASVTVKPGKTTNNKGSFKLTTSYKLSLADARTGISYTSKNVETSKFVITEDRDSKPVLLNANVKGRANKFNEYFQLTKDGDGKYSLCLDFTQTDLAKALESRKDGSTVKLSEQIAKEDLTGYFTYSVPVNGVTKSETAKITVKLVDDKTGSSGITAGSAEKYTIANTSVVDVNGKNVNLYVKHGKNDARIAYALVEDEAASYNMTSVATVAEDSQNVIALTSSTDKPAAGKHKLTVYLIPKGSYDETAIEKLSTDNDKAAYIKNYGVKVNTNLNVEEAAKAKNIIALKTKSVTFYKEDYIKGGSINSEAVYNGSYGGTVINYTNQKQVALKTAHNGALTVDYGDLAAYNEGEKHIVDFRLMSVWDNGGHIKPLLNKELYEKNEAALQKKSYKVTLKLEFADSSIPAQDIQVTVKMPGEDKNRPDEDDLKLDTVSKKIQADYGTILAGAGISTSAAEWESYAITDNKSSKEGGTGRYQQYYDDGQYKPVYLSTRQIELVSAQNAIVDYIKKHNYIPNRSDVVLTYATLNKDNASTYNKGKTVAGVTFTEPGTDAGSITFNFTLYKCTKCASGTVNHKGNTDPSKELTFKIDLSKKAATGAVSKVETILSNLSSGKGEDNFTVTNATTAFDILDYVRKQAAKDGDNKVEGAEIYLDGGEDSFDIQPATDAKPGTINITLRVRDALYGNELSGINGISQEITIQKLNSLSEIAGKISLANLKEADGTTKFVVTNFTTNDELLAAVDRFVKSENADVSVKYATKKQAGGTVEKDEDGNDVLDIDRKEAKKSGDGGEGYIKAKFVLENPNGVEAKSFTTDEAITFTIAELKSDTDVIDAVKKAAITETKDGDSAIKLINKLQMELVYADDSSDVTDDAVKEAILKAANDAIKGEPYEVKFAEDYVASSDTIKDGAANDPVTFEFKPNKYKAGEGDDTGKGSIKFQLLLVSKKKANGDPMVAATNMPEDTDGSLKCGTKEVPVTIDVNPELQTFTEAKDAIDTIANGFNDEALDEILPVSVDESTAQSKLLEKLNAGIATGNDNLSLEVAIVKDSFAAATPNSPAKLSYTYTLTLKKEGKEVKAVTSEPADLEGTKKVTQDISAAVTAVKTASNYKTIVLRNKDFDAEKKLTNQAQEDAIVAVASELVDKEKYTVAVDTTKEANHLTLTEEATTQKTGKAKITLTITPVAAGEEAGRETAQEAELILDVAQEVE